MPFVKQNSEAIKKCPKLLKYIVVNDDYGMLRENILQTKPNERKIHVKLDGFAV